MAAARGSALWAPRGLREVLLGGIAAQPSGDPGAASSSSSLGYGCAGDGGCGGSVGRGSSGGGSGGRLPLSARSCSQGGASAQTQRAGGDLLAPLPNLFRGTFQQAKRDTPGEQWLRQRIRDFDSGSKQRRKQVLQEFLEYVEQSAASGLEELFSISANLFLVRLTSWFSVTLPMHYELPLQLKVFLTFLEFREQVFVRAFFESGAIVPLMKTLSIDFDVSDEVRSSSLTVLQKLAANGRHHKELLCSQGLIAHVMDSVSDGLRWETLKCAGRLLCELFRSNPRYQSQVLDALQDFLAQRLPLTQRAGAQALLSLLGGEAHQIPPLLCEPARHRVFVQRALALLDCVDLRVGADAYCLVCRLLRNFGCDELLFPFARAQLRTERSAADEWFRLETDMQDQPNWREEEGLPFGGQQKGIVTRLHGRIADALGRDSAGPRDGGSVGPELIQKVNRTNAEFCEAFRAEAGQILKWGLMLYLAKRNSGLCTELVDGGLTEMLLMCLLDVAHPVRQAAALSELHRLQLLSPKAQSVVETVLVRQAMLRAMSIDQFMAAASPEDMARARYRLRNMRAQEPSKTVSAQELGLQQHLMEKSMAETLSVRPQITAAFLTEDREATVDGDGKPQQVAEQAVSRCGGDCYDVKRVPLLPDGAEAAPGGGASARYRIDMGSIEEIPFGGNLASFLLDPLTASADEENPFTQEVHGFDASMGPGSARKAAQAALPWRRVQASSLKKSHRSSLQHSRALALRPVTPMALAVWPSPRRRAASRAESECSVMSLRCVAVDGLQQSQPGSAHVRTCCSCRARAAGEAADGKLPPLHHHHHHQHLSLAETSMGTDQPTWELSQDEFSRELPSFSQGDAIVGGCSQMTAGTDSMGEMPSEEHQHSAQLDLLKPVIESSPHGGPVPGVVVERSTITAIVEVPRLALGHWEGHDSGHAAPVAPKRLLHVAPAPYHECVAFDKAEHEHDRLHTVEAFLGTATKRLLVDIEGAGRFPRKALLGSGTGRAPSAPTWGPWTARAPRRRLRLGASSAGQSCSQSLAGDGPAKQPGSHGTAGSPVDKFSSSPAAVRGIPMALSDLRSNRADDSDDDDPPMRSFFPASAR